MLANLFFGDNGFALGAKGLALGAKGLVLGAKGLALGANGLAFGDNGFGLGAGAGAGALVVLVGDGETDGVGIWVTSGFFAPSWNDWVGFIWLNWLGVGSFLNSELAGLFGKLKTGFLTGVGATFLSLKMNWIILFPK